MARLRLRSDLLAELLKPDGLATLMTLRPVTKGTGVQTDCFIVGGQGFGGAALGIQEVSEVQVPLGILGVPPDCLSEGREGLLRPPRGQQGQGEVAVGLRVAGRPELDGPSKGARRLALPPGSEEGHTQVVVYR